MALLLLSSFVFLQETTLPDSNLFVLAEVSFSFIEPGDSTVLSSMPPWWMLLSVLLLSLLDCASYSVSLLSRKFGLIVFPYCGVKVELILEVCGRVLENSYLFNRENSGLWWWVAVLVTFELCLELIRLYLLWYSIFWSREEVKS